MEYEWQETRVGKRRKVTVRVGWLPSLTVRGGAGKGGVTASYRQGGTGRRGACVAQVAAITCVDRPPVPET